MNENYYNNLNFQNVDAIIDEYAKIINDFLSNEVASIIINESKGIKEVYQPILYSLLNSGKRIRPILFLLISGFHTNLSEEEKKEFLITASSIELIHTYSLIHDDLPAMDNDDLRRGKYTCHKQYTEWSAILAGDSLNTLAFYLLSLTNYNIRSKIYILSKYAGIGGMITGQALDLSNQKNDYPEPTNQFLQYSNYFVDKKFYIFLEEFIQPEIQEKLIQLLLIHYHKTTALFIGAVELALITGKINNAIEFSESVKTSYQEYAEIIGLLFQITDDVLDEIGDEHLLGKKIHKDKELGKLTFPNLLGIDKSIELSKKLAIYSSNLVKNFILPYTKKDMRHILEILPFYILNRKK